MNKTYTPDCRFKDARVLIAEDNDFSLAVLKHMLEIFGIQPDQAVDGRETIDLLKTKQYDLLILDIHMPIKDGNEAAKEVRQMPIDQPILVALTASVFETEKQVSMDAGFDDYYNKPLELPTLESILKKYLKDKMVLT